MGWTFRKSVKLGGGFRLNLSSKGMGISGGVKGARISVGPTGTRVSAGTGPFRYQKTISAGSRSGGTRRLTAQERQELEWEESIAPLRVSRPIHWHKWFFGCAIFFCYLALANPHLLTFAIPFAALGFFLRNGTRKVRGWRYFLQFEKAVTAEEKFVLIDQAFQLYPALGIRLYRAEALLEVGRKAEALTEAGYVANQVQNPVVMYLVSKCLIANEHWESALKWLEFIDEPEEWDDRLVKGFIEALGLKAECYIGLKEFDKALAVIQIGLSKRKEVYVEPQRELRLLKARTLHCSGKTPLALKELQKLLDDVPNHQKALELLKELRKAS